MLGGLRKGAASTSKVVICFLAMLFQASSSISPLPAKIFWQKIARVPRFRLGSHRRAPTPRAGTQNKQADITIVGLGPSRPQSITEEALATIESSRKFFARTREHPALARFSGMPMEPTVFDDIYDSSKDFSEVYEAIAEKIVTFAEKLKSDGRSSAAGVVYGVPGDPTVAEATVGQIFRIATQRGLRVRVVSGVSFIEPVLAAVGTDILPRLLVLDALDISGRYYPPLPTATPLLITQLYRREIASEVKLALEAMFDETHKIAIVHDAGGTEELIEWIPLYELDHDPQNRIGLRTALFVPPQIVGDPSTPEGVAVVPGFEDAVELAFQKAVDDGFDPDLEMDEGDSIEIFSDPPPDENAGQSLVDASRQLADCIARSSRENTVLEDMQREEEALTDAFGTVLAEVLVQFAQAREAGLVGDKRITDVIYSACYHLQADDRSSYS
ncbi:hypothetical protein AAMO2058_000252300 [Amorphochlora amoebiformis]